MTSQDKGRIPKKAIPLSELPVIDKKGSIPENNEQLQSGAVILMDKPEGWSSFDLVKYVRNRINVRKVGHAGTLDPLATGLLILCCGKATKSISQIQNLDKTYVATIRFGSSTPSYDAATEPDQFADWDHIKQIDIQKVLEEHFSGSISQTPPIYSAIRIKGERLYKIARRGEDVHIEPRKVNIYETMIQEVNMPDVKLKIRCGKGTYIRSVAHDLGILLDSRAHITSLRRTDTGHYSVKNGFTPEEFNTEIHSLRNG